MESQSFLKRPCHHLLCWQLNPCRGYVLGACKKLFLLCDSTLLPKNISSEILTQNSQFRPKIHNSWNARLRDLQPICSTPPSPDPFIIGVCCCKNKNVSRSALKAAEQKTMTSDLLLCSFQCQSWDKLKYRFPACVYSAKQVVKGSI